MRTRKVRSRSSAGLWLIAAGIALSALLLWRSHASRSAQQKMPAPATAAPLDPTEDGLPGADRPFQRLDILAEPEWRARLLSSYVNEGAQYYDARREAGAFLIDQPEEVPARWSYDIHGVSLRRTRLAGDFDADVVLDLGRSRISPRKGDPGRYSSFTVETVFAGEGRTATLVYYAPSCKGFPRGAVWNNRTDEVVSWREPIRSLAFHLRHRGQRLSVTVASEKGPLGRVLDWQDPMAARPIRQIDLGVEVDRPAGALQDSAWKAPGRDVYAVSAFSICCASPKGCTVREP